MNIPQLNYKEILRTCPTLDAKYGSNKEEPTNVTRQDLQDLGAQMIMTNKYSIIEKDPEEQYGHGPVKRAFFLVIHPDLVWWFILIPGYIHADLYPKKKGKVKGELGAISNFRLIVDNAIPRNIGIDYDNVTTYNCLCFGGEYAKPEDFINLRVTKEE